MANKDYISKLAGTRELDETLEKLEATLVIFYAPRINPKFKAYCYSEECGEVKRGVFRSEYKGDIFCTSCGHALVWKRV